MNTKRIQFGPRPVRWSFPEAVLAIGGGWDDLLKGFARLDVGAFAVRDGGDFLAHGPVSIVVMRDVLEHSENPHTLLRAVRQALSPAGLLACEVINADAAGPAAAGRQAFNLGRLRDALTRAGFSPREAFFAGRKVSPFGKRERQYERVGFYATPAAEH